MGKSGIVVIDKLYQFVCIQMIYRDNIIYNGLFYGQCVMSLFYVQQTQLKCFFTAKSRFLHSIGC